MNAEARIEQIDDFFVREFALYLNEHRHPANRLTHMLGIPIIIVTMVAALILWSWQIFLGGQLVGWFFQLVGHRIEGNRPALLRRPISFLMGPLMVLVELGEHFGAKPRFAAEARAHVFGGPLPVSEHATVGS